MGKFITDEGLVQLKNYKYASSKYTFLDGKLNAYWQWIVQFVPLWMAPNLITFIGFLFVIASYVNMLRYDYSLEKDIPNWCFLFAAACTWIYSTLDAIDGKQARRTKSSSPLGQLFDHGCDSFSTAFFIEAVGQATKLTGMEMFALFLSTQLAFWIASWLEHKTGVLLTSVGQFGVTECHLIVITIHLITGIFGQQCWQIYLIDILPKFILSSFSQQISHLKIGGFIALFFGALIILLSLYEIIKTILKSQQRLQNIKQVFPIALVIAVELIWVNFSFYQKYKGLVLLNFGLLTSLLICKIIISSVAKMKLSVFHFQILPLIIGTVLMIICETFGLTKTQPAIFWSIFIVNTLFILYFLQGVITQITDFLGINCFSIKQKSN